jgi:hypothetical protein
VALGVVVVVVGAALLSPLIAPQDPYDIGKLVLGELGPETDEGRGVAGAHVRPERTRGSSAA